MLKLKKTVVAVALGVGCVASAQAWYEGALGTGTLSSGSDLVGQNTFGLFSSSLISVNANVLDWYTFSVAPGVSNATGALTVSSTGLNLGVGFDNLTFSVYEGTYTGGLTDAFQVAFPGISGLHSVGSFGLKSDGTLNGAFDFNPAVSNYTLVITGVAADLTLFGKTEYTFTMSAVPEPAEYAMLLAGLGVVGMISRRRRVR